MADLSHLVREGNGCLSMRRFWVTVSHPVTVDRLKCLHHITDQGDQLGHHRGSEISRVILATKGSLGGRGTWERRKLWEPTTEKSWQVWLVGTRGQCLHRLYRAVATMVLETMSQLLKEAGLSQISQLLVIPECIPACSSSAGLFQQLEHSRGFGHSGSGDHMSPSHQISLCPRGDVVLKTFLNPNLSNCLLLPLTACIQVCELASIPKKKSQNRLSTHSWN